MDDGKGQVVRLMDVFVFGPLMIAAAQTQRSNYFKTALTVIGIGTIAYNGMNYYLQKRDEKESGSVAGIPSRAQYVRPARH